LILRRQVIRSAPTSNPDVTVVHHPIIADDGGYCALVALRDDRNTAYLTITDQIPLQYDPFAFESDMGPLLVLGAMADFKPPDLYKIRLDVD
jgi:hypothetical protein